MCISKLFKKTLAIIPGQVDVIKGCDPTPEFVDGLSKELDYDDFMPTMSIPDLIEQLDFRSSIHETYYVRIVEGKFPPDAGYGDANFQLWAIEGYQCAIHYLKKLSGGDVQ